MRRVQVNTLHGWVFGECFKVAPLDNLFGSGNGGIIFSPKMRQLLFPVVLATRGHPPPCDMQNPVGLLEARKVRIIKPAYS